MLKSFKIWAMLIGLLCLTACHHDEPELKKSRRTVILYMMAENGMSQFASDDIREIIKGAGDIPLDCNFVVYLDKTSLPQCFTYGAQTGESLWKTYPEHDSCDSTTFRNTLADIIKAYPAESYGLILWSHGSGWIPAPAKASAKGQHKTIGIDNNLNSPFLDEGSELEIPSLRGALESLGVEWEYIFFDACFMQCVEVDYELRNVCRSVVASPAEMPGDGAPYHLMMKDFFREDKPAEHIAETYHEAYKDHYQGGVVISASCSSEMDGLARTMRPFVTRLFANHRQYDMTGVQEYCPFKQETRWKPEYLDLASTMNQLLASPVDYASLMAQLDKAYPVHLYSNFWMSVFYYSGRAYITDPEHIASVSMFFPHEKYDFKGYNEYLHRYQWYHASGFDQTGW